MRDSGADRRHRRTGMAKMSEFVVAIGLVLVIEGLLFAAFPRAAKRLAASALESARSLAAGGRHRFGGARRRADLVGARVKRRRAGMVADARRFRIPPQSQA